MPRFRAVATLLADGALGDVRAVTVRTTSAPQMWDPGHLPWRVLPEIAGGGLFVDLGSHTLDLLDHLLPENWRDTPSRSRVRLDGRFGPSSGGAAHG